MEKKENLKMKKKIKEENGQNYWNFMHTLAAYYPEEATESQRKKMDFFVDKSCDYFLIEDKWKKRWKRNIEALPPTLSSQKDFSIWMCKQHNIINKQIGKPMFPCIQERLEERWGPVKLKKTNDSKENN
jgi:mitochondrial FAD-linked sulfhydryl oxidase